MSKTCERCPHVKLNVMRSSTWAYCENTEDELIVPHEWDGDSVRFIRIPEFCPLKTESNKDSANE